MVARDQERILFYELDSGQLSYVDLDFCDSQEASIYWTSPECLALDRATDRLWIINDPNVGAGQFPPRGRCGSARPLRRHGSFAF